MKEGENARPVVNFGSTFLWPAILLSVAVHGLLLSLHFRFPDASKAFRDRALDIILVNSRSATRPTDPQAHAQVDMDGGGNSEENRRTKTPLPAAPKQRPGDELERSRKRVQELEAQYIEDWRAKVERIGTLNYPAAARGKLYGKLILSVSIRSDGSVINVEIDRSSGHKILDDAARRIVRMGAPYGAFPPAMRRDTGDIIVITRTLTFKSDSLATR